MLKLESEQSNLTTDQKIANAQKVFELQNDLAKKGLSGTDEQKALIENSQELSSALLTIADDQINAETEKQKRIIAANKAATAEIYDEQTQNAELLAQAQIALLNKNLLTERAYADEVLKINTAKNEALTLIQTNFDEAERIRRETEAANLKALEDVSFEIRIQDILGKSATEAEIKQLIRDEEYAKELTDLDANLKAKTISNEVYLAKLDLANKKYNSDTKKNDKILADQKRAQSMSVLNDGLNALGQLFEGSKAIAVAQALVNTYQGITAGLKLGYPLAIPAVAFAALSGFAAVKNILKTTKTTSSADTSTASAPTTSGSGNFVNTAQTETVARVSDRPVEQSTIVTPPVLILEQLNEAQDNLLVKQTSG